MVAAEWKKNIVSEIQNKINKYKTVAVINMENLPAKQLQIIREKISENAQIIMSRKKLIKLALENSEKKSTKKLIEHLTGMSALLFSNKNAFELFKTLKKNMSDAPAKAGQISPKDIIIQKGPTPFPPGPMISEFSKVGIKTGIEGGKIAVKDDKLVAKKGDVISENLANLLSKLQIHPMKIGINLICALENEFLFLRDVLDINEEQFINNIKEAYLNALKLSIGRNIITQESAQHLIQQAYLDAKKLGIGTEILTDETKDYLLKKAESIAKTLKSKINI